MRNNCFVPSKENNRNMEQLAREIEGGKSLTSNEMPSAKSLKLAHFLLANNNGMMPNLTPNGKNSTLFLNLEKTLGSKSAAYKAKAYIYTQDFAERYGEWVGQFDENGKPLPEPMWKSEFASDWVKDTFDISNDTRADLETYLFKNTYSTILDDAALSKVHLYDADPNALTRTIDEDRRNTVNKWISDGKTDYPEKDLLWEETKRLITLSHPDESPDELQTRIDSAQYLFYKSLYNDKLLDKLITGAKDSMVLVWGLLIDDNTGQAINTVDKASDPDLYDVVLVRCNIINSLTKESDNYLLGNTNNRQIVYNLILNYLTGVPAPSLASSMFTSYMDLYKGTQIVQDVLINLNYLKPKTNLKNYDDLVKKAYIRFRGDFQEKIDEYISGKKPKASILERFVNMMHSIMDAVLFHIALGFSNKAVSTSSYAAAIVAGLSVAGAVGTVPMVATAAGLVTSVAFLHQLAKSHVKVNYGDQQDIDLRSWKTYRKNRTDAIQKLAVAISLNKDLVLEYSGVQYGVKNFISDILVRQRGGTMLLVFGKIAESLQSLLKAMREDEDVSSVTSMISLLEDAIMHQNTDDYHAKLFFHRYLSYVYDLLDDAILDLKRMRDDIKNVDPEKLFKIKTDTIGAYDITVRHYLSAYMLDIPLDEFGVDGDFYKLVQELASHKIAVAKNEFSLTLDLFTNFYANTLLDETAAKTTNLENLSRMRENVQHWLKNEINNYGQLGIAERLIVPARSSTSPVVRMLKQKMEEINDYAEKQANDVGQLLEHARVDVRSIADRFSLMNQNIRYMERSSDGRFTGNFVSDTNVGEYEYLALAERDFLDNKYGVKRGPSNTPIWESEDLWLKWNIDYIIWMAGGKRTELGEYKRPTDESNVRIHRRHKMQYYIDKATILGREGTELLSDIDTRISNIEKLCMDSVLYKDSNGDKVTRTFPNIAKLPIDLRLRLQELQNRKRLLSSFYDIKWTNDGKKIKAISMKTNSRDIELAKRFLEWDLKKSTYYVGKPTVDYDFFNAVVKQYEDADNHAQLLEFLKIYTRVEYNQIIQDSFKVEGKKVYALKDKNGEDIEACRKLVSLKRLRNTLRALINSNNEKRTPNLSLIGEDISSEETANLWKQIADVDRQIARLEKQIETTNKNASPDKKIITYMRIDPSVNVGKKSRKTYTARESVPLLSEDNEDLKVIFWEYLLLKNPHLRERDISDGKHVVPFFSREALNFDAYMQFASKIPSSLFYVSVPLQMFKRGDSIVVDDKFDTSSTDYIQVNKSFVDTNGSTPFDNTEAYEKVKNDAFYKKMLQITDEAWKNYKGLTRAYKYMLPQREFTMSDQIGRALSLTKTFKKGVSDTFSKIGHDAVHFNNRDLDEDYRDEVIVRPDGSIVETVSSRWTKRLRNRNAIDSDLVSSVIDFYNESLKYSVRKKYAPIMELMHFQLSGGYNASGNTTAKYQADVLRHEMSKILYGRTYTGSGLNGRISPDEVALAKLTRSFRGLLHLRLMSHNWLSVLKNAWDSMCNLCQAALTAKYIMTRNIIKALQYLFFDEKANGLARFALAGQVWGINRSSATNLTQALMLLNGVQENVHSRFSKQHQWGVRRLLAKSESIEFEGIDYTSKAIITNAVYDAYRLMYNPNTGNYEFLNEEEAEFAYMSYGSTNGRLDGYDAWVKADVTLRDVYEQDKNGVAVLKKEVEVTGPALDVNTGKIVDKINKLNVLDIIRPKSDISVFEDGRSRVLETKVRTTIKQMCQVSNGMLDEMDKSLAATHYAGALLFAFRGWMISQSSEFYKNGYDFLDYSKDSDTQTGLQKVITQLQTIRNMPMRRKGVAYDADYAGMYNFATGTIDVGLHRGLLANLLSHLGAAIRMMFVIPNYLPRTWVGSTSKQRLLGNQRNMSQSQFYQLRNFAAAFDMLILTIAATAGALMMYLDDDDSDDGPMSKKAMKSLLYTAMLASISERFPQLGKGAFIINISDIVKSLSVGVTLLDDVQYVISTGMYLVQLLEGTINDKYVTDDLEIFGYLVNGAFKGKTRLQRGVTRTAAIFGIDTAPLLGSVDLYNWLTEDAPSWLLLPDIVRDQLWLEYNLNVYKNITEPGNVGRAKFYQDIIPTNLLVPLLEDTPFKIAPDSNSSNKPKKSNNRRLQLVSAG